MVRRQRRRRRTSTAPTAALHRLLWLEPLWIGLLAPSLLFPGRVWVVAWQGALVLFLFVFWPLRIALRRLRVQHLLHKRDAVLELMASGQPLSGRA